MSTRIAAARQWTGNGFEAIKRGAVNEARTCFTKASSQLPDDHHIVANLARTHFQSGQIDQAIEAMQRAVALSNDDAELHIELGEYYLAAGRIREATTQADLGLERNHRLASAWSLKGKTAASVGDFHSALGHFQRALGIDGSREDIQMEIVMAYQRLGEPLRALSSVEQLLEKYPKDRQPESAIIAKSAALIQLSQLSPAIEVLEVASHREDVSGQIFINLAKAQVAAGRSPEAIQTLAKATRRFPDRSDIGSLANELRADAPRVAALQ